MHRTLRAAWADQAGISALEYAILATAILAGLFAAAGPVNTGLALIFTQSIPGYL